VAFDRNTLSIVGHPKSVVPNVAMTREGAANFDVSRDGTLVYEPGQQENDLVTLTWIDRHGREQPVDVPPFSYRYPRLSPDSHRIALGSPRDLAMWDDNAHKLTWFGFGTATYPIWMPDGKQIVFASTRAGAANIYRQVVDGTLPAVRLTESQYNQFPSAISPDGRYLVFREDSATSDLMLLDLSNPTRIQPLIHTPSMESNADISPDGTLLTFQS